MLVNCMIDWVVVNGLQGAMLGTVPGMRTAVFDVRAGGVDDYLQVGVRCPVVA